MIPEFLAGLSRLFWRLHAEEGQALAEYGLLLALVVIASLIALAALGLAIAGIFSSVSIAMP